MNATEIRLVAFDWGGVLMRIARSWKEALVRTGLPADVPTAAGEIDIDARIAPIGEALGEGRIGFRQFCEQVVHVLGGICTADDVAQIHDACLIEDYPGTVEIVEALNAYPSVRTALLSNTDERHWQRRQPGPTGEAPEFLAASLVALPFASHEVGAMKPNARIYEALESGTGCRGGEILFFDDLEPNVAAADARGWRTVLIDPHTDTAPQIRRALNDAGIEV